MSCHRHVALMSIVGHTAYDAARGPVGGASDSCEGSVARRRDCNCEVAAEMWCARGGGLERRGGRRSGVWAKEGQMETSLSCFISVFLCVYFFYSHGQRWPV